MVVVTCVVKESREMIRAPLDEMGPKWETQLHSSSTLHTPDMTELQLNTDFIPQTTSRLNPSFPSHPTRRSDPFSVCVCVCTQSFVFVHVHLYMYLGQVYIPTNQWCNIMSFIIRGQMAERLGIRTINQKVVGLIPGCARWRCVLGHGTSPYLPRGNVPVLTVSRSG